MESSLPDSSVGKESACNAGYPSPVPGLGRSTGEWIDYPLQYSWASLVAQLVKNLPSMGETWVQFLGWEDPWRRERLPTPGFWPGEFHGLYSPWGCKKSDTTEWLSLSRIMVHKLYLKKFYYTSKSHVFFVWPSVSSAADRVNKMKIKNWPLIFAKWHHLTKPFHSGRTD